MNTLKSETVKYFQSLTVDLCHWRYKDLIHTALPPLCGYCASVYMLMKNFFKMIHTHKIVTDFIILQACSPLLWIQYTLRITSKWNDSTAGGHIIGVAVIPGLQMSIHSHSLPHVKYSLLPDGCIKFKQWGGCILRDAKHCFATCFRSGERFRARNLDTWRNECGQLSASTSIKQKQLGLSLSMRNYGERQRGDEAVLS